MNHLRPLLAFACLLATGCARVQELPSLVDRWSFEHFGSTPFSNPETLTLKEIHLDNGNLAGREIVVEGKIVQVSDHSTYLVLSDDSARMLVVLTDLDQSGPLAQLSGGTKSRVMRVLGTVESGRKGLPFVKARSLSLAKEPPAAGAPPAKA
jgi:hypothetical protein